MSRMKEIHITVSLLPSHTLAETWEQLASSFAGGGATKAQVDTMKTAFYIGAAQTYARIDGNTTSFTAFCDIMRDIHIEIDGHMGIGDVAGHA